jgi:hypothetical protein
MGPQAPGSQTIAASPKMRQKSRLLVSRARRFRANMGSTILNTASAPGLYGSYNFDLTDCLSL